LGVGQREKINTSLNSLSVTNIIVFEIISKVSF